MIEKVTQLRCDVFNTIRGTQHYRVVIMRIDEQGRLLDNEDPPVLSEMIDLGPKGYERLTSAIYRTLKREPPSTPFVPPGVIGGPVAIIDDDGDSDPPTYPHMTPAQKAIADEVVKDARAESNPSPTGGDA